MLSFLVITASMAAHTRFCSGASCVSAFFGIHEPRARVHAHVVGATSLLVAVPFQTHAIDTWQP